MKQAHTLAELARKSGTPPRTIRFYIARGILQGPSQAGRNAAYGPAHVERLGTIARLKREGLTLTDIAVRLTPGSTPEEIRAPATCHSYALTDDVTVLVRADVPPWRMNRIRKALAGLAAQLGKEPADEK
jgi:DNA-binding transcriptional MerR regulator